MQKKAVVGWLDMINIIFSIIKLFLFPLDIMFKYIINIKGIKMRYMFIKLVLLLAVSLSADANMHTLSPKDGAKDVSADIKIRVSYDKKILSSSIKKRTVKLKRKNKRVKGEISIEGEKTLVFTPNKKLKTGEYKLKVRPLFLLSDKEIKPKGFFQKIMFKICSFYYKDKKECPYYKYLARKNKIRTEPIHSSFSVNADIPLLQSLTLSSDKEEIQERKSTQLSLVGLYSNGSEKEIKKEIEWIVQNPNHISIDENLTLTALSEGETTLQAKVNDITSNILHVNIFQEINGHRLPPEPDPQVNNSTILGVDSNDNGVRDDVERKIYKTYDKAIDQAHMIQLGRSFVKILENPVVAANAKENIDERWNYFSCIGYLAYLQKITLTENIVDFIEDAYMNTRERMKAYVEYIEASSGGVYSIPVLDKDLKKENCDFDVDAMLEMDR